MWPDSRLCKLLGTEHPIIQAPMLGSCTPELAGAVSNAGGLGSLGCAEKPDAMIREQVGALRSCTNRGFNLNFFIIEDGHTDPDVLEAVRARLAPRYRALGLGEPPADLPPPRGFDDGYLALMLDLKPAVLSFHFGCPGAAAVAALKGAGITLISTATTVEEARALEAAGMDAIVAQGWEAGGHRGSHRPIAPSEGVGTLALVPQIVDAVTVPVIAAGGIADGRGIAAALALGAAGVQMGTAFLRCPEAATDAARRALLATAGESDTIMTDAYSGRAARAVRSRFAAEMAQSQQPLARFPQMRALSTPIRDAAPDAEASFHLYGQAAALAREVPAGDLVQALVADTRHVLARLHSGTN